MTAMDIRGQGKQMLIRLVLATLGSLHVLHCIERMTSRLGSRNMYDRQSKLHSIRYVYMMTHKDTAAKSSFISFLVLLLLHTCSFHALFDVNLLFNAIQTIIFKNTLAVSYLSVCRASQPRSVLESVYTSCSSSCQSVEELRQTCGSGKQVQGNGGWEAYHRR